MELVRGVREGKEKFQETSLSCRKAAQCTSSRSSSQMNRGGTLAPGGVLTSRVCAHSELPLTLPGSKHTHQGDASLADVHTGQLW